MPLPMHLASRCRARSKRSGLQCRAPSVRGHSGWLHQRSAAGGIEKAKAKGIYKGRPVTFDHAKIVALRKEGLGTTEIARAVGYASAERLQGPQGRWGCLGDARAVSPDSKRLQRKQQ